MPPTSDLTATRVLLNPAALSSSYLPKDLPHRDKEVRILSSVAERYAITSITPPAILIKGRPGVGKTAVSLNSTLGRFDSERLRVIHVNCRKYPSPNTVVRIISRGVGGPFVPERGLSMGELILFLEEGLAAGATPTALILDEINYLRDPADLIYALLRIHETSKVRVPPMLILISREWIPEFLFERSIWSFFSIRLNLKPYTRNQLYDIIRYRAREALDPRSYDDNLLMYIAEAASVSGDARQAIRLLYRAALLAEASDSSEITLEHVRIAEAEDSPVMDRAAVDQLSVHEKLILLAAAKRLKEKQAMWLRMGELEGAYREICEVYGVPPFKHTAVWRRVKNLSSEGYISTRRSGEGMRGQTTLISINGPLERLIQIIEGDLDTNLGKWPEDWS